MIKNGMNIVIVHVILITCLFSGHDFMYSEIKGSKANHTHLLFNANTANKGKPSQRNLLKSITIEFIEKRRKQKVLACVCRCHFNHFALFEAFIISLQRRISARLTEQASTIFNPKNSVNCILLLAKLSTYHLININWNTRKNKSTVNQAKIRVCKVLTRERLK